MLPISLLCVAKAALPAARLALVVFPGGFGTIDELFDALTLRQTSRMQAIPIILYGRDYWNRVIDFQFLADEGVIEDEHLSLLSYAESPQEIIEILKQGPLAPMRAFDRGRTRHPAFARVASYAPLDTLKALCSNVFSRNSCDNNCLTTLRSAAAKDGQSVRLASACNRATFVSSRT